MLWGCISDHGNRCVCECITDSEAYFGTFEGHVSFSQEVCGYFSRIMLHDVAL